MLERPIFIIGSPRSGTTLLGQVLSHHPDLAYAEEPRLVWRHSNDKRSDCLRVADARPEVVREIRRFFADHVATRGKRRLLEKLPSNSLRMDFVRHVFPDGLFVHVIRNAYDSVLSIRSYSQAAVGLPPRGLLLRRMRETRVTQWPRYGKEAARRLLPRWMRPGGPPPSWGPRLPGMDQLTRELDPLTVAALQWRACVEAACQSGRRFPPDQYFELRLEDMGEHKLREIMKFCGLSASEEVVKAFHAKFRPEDPTGRWTNAKPEDLEHIRFLTEPTMQWLGYPTQLPSHDNNP